MAKSPAERAAVWNAIERASHYAMGLVARDLGWARRGAGGKEGADPGDVAWVSFRHHNARPTTAVQDGRDGATLLADVPVVGDPNSHIHYLLFNVVVTDDGRIGSLDTKQFTRTKQHYYDAMFQGRLADELRRLGIRTEMHEKEKAIVISAVPEKANDAFSKGTRQVLRHAKAYAESHGLVWDEMSAEQKFKILGVSGLAARLKKDGGRGAERVWLEVAQAIGWERESVLENHKARQMPDSERWQLGYKYAAKHLAQEFETQGVVDYDKLEMYAAMGLIGVGSKGGENDVARVAELLETRGIMLRGEHVALITGATRKGIKVTNTAQLRIEESVLKLARKAGQDRSMTLSTEEINAAIARSDLDFTKEPEASAEQIAAIHSLGSGSSLSMLTGVAGAGKSTILRVLVDAWKKDTRLSPEGREIIGIATAWRQADALKEAGIGKTYALQPFLGQLGKREPFEDFIAAVEKGTFVPTRNTVLVIDEVSQIGPRPMQKLLEVQAKTGMTIKALGDREQTQAIEAGDAVELLQRALPEEDLPYLNHTVRQKDKRGRHIAGLFRAGAAAEAIDELRKGGEAALIGGDHEQVVNRLAEFYLQRRDLHRSAGTGLTVTMTAPTNQDVADLSVSVRTKLEERGEIGPDERVLPAIDQRGEEFEMPLAVGDQLRLFRRTYARTKAGERLTFCNENHIGNNGSLVTVLSVSDTGITVSGKGVQKGETKVGEIPWSQLVDVKTGRFLVGFGHALTIDAAQGIRSYGADGEGGAPSAPTRPTTE